MSRYIFAQNRLVAAAPAGGTGLASTAGLLVRIYTDAAATLLADILTLGGGAIPNSELTVDSSSQLPLFQGPDGVGTLYVKATAGGAISTINARLDSVAPVASNRLTTPAGLDVSITGKLGVGVAAPAKPLDVTSAVHTAQIKSTTVTNGQHALTAWMAGTNGDNQVALNVVSDNELSSSQYISGQQQNRGTLKISHTKPSGTDTSSSALAIDLVGAGTAAQGIALITTDPTTGNLLLLRNNGRDDLVVKGTGRVGIGLAIAATPGAMVEVLPYDASTKAMLLRAFAAGASILEARDSSDVAQLVITNTGQLAWKLAPKWDAAGLEQTTVGAAGGASAPPATPTAYLKVTRPSGGTLVIPCYAP